MVVGYGISSCVIWVGDGSGGVKTKSTISSSAEGFVVFTFFVLPCFAPESTNRLNFVQNDILFVVACSMMSIAVANSSSSSSDSDRMSLRFPFPFSLLFSFSLRLLFPLLVSLSFILSQHILYYLIQHILLSSLLLPPINEPG